MGHIQGTLGEGKGGATPTGILLCAYIPGHSRGVPAAVSIDHLNKPALG